MAAEPTKVDGLLLEAYGSGDAPLDGWREFLDSKSYIAERIAERAKTKILFRQPSILLVYRAG